MTGTSATPPFSGMSKGLVYHFQAECWIIGKYVSQNLTSAHHYAKSRGKDAGRSILQWRGVSGVWVKQCEKTGASRGAELKTETCYPHWTVVGEAHVYG